MLGIVDGDVVEASNLHRQIGHATSRVGTNKATSLVTYLRDLNPLPCYVEYPEHLSTINAIGIVEQYDLVLDCTDHPTSRYLISDTCVLLGRPLVSASALRTDGQLMVLNCPAAPQENAKGGPCYRCVFPKPPPPDTVISCGEGGILGPVVGVMGVLQALEALKVVVAGMAPTRAERAERSAVEGGGKEAASSSATAPSMLLFSVGDAGPTFRTVRMRGRRKDCYTCGSSTLGPEDLTKGHIDYIRLCGVQTPVATLPPELRISPTELRNLYAGRSHLVLDVREKEHYAMGSIEGAVNVPFSAIRGPGIVERLAAMVDFQKQPVFVVCRVGNDSQDVVEHIKRWGTREGKELEVRDIKGGMKAWKAEVDEMIPFV